MANVLCAAVWAQPGPELVEADPIRCWWRTSQGAVSVGQPFALVLTCAVLENDSVRVVPDESPLAVGAVQLAPFELLGGSHPADLRSGQRRFFQYDYNVRLIDPAAIGKDVSLPALAIHYRVESRLQGQALEGRDRTYLLPAEAVHIVSMVPSDAADIRDGSDAPFAAIEATRFRARMFDIASVALGALGLILLIPAAVRAMGLTRARAKTATAGVSNRALLARATSELAAAQDQGRGGWTPDLAARALTATRIIAGYAIARPPRQHVLMKGEEAADGRLPVASGFLRKHRAAAASATTAEDLARAIERVPAGAPAARRGLLEKLHDALTAMTRSQYAQAPLSDSEMDDAVRAAREAGEQVRREHGWLRSALNRTGP